MGNLLESASITVAPPVVAGGVRDGQATSRGGDSPRSLLPPPRRAVGVSAAGCGERLDKLQGHVLTQIREALGPWGAWMPGAILERCCGKAARRFAQRVAAFDDLAGRAGIVHAARHVLPRVVPAVTVSGARRIPGSGPLLVLANHPGLYDFLAVLAQMPRSDLKVVAKEQAYWETLPGLTASLITVGRQATACRDVLRDAFRHLSRGGALLTFPGGRIEPDPARESTAAPGMLENWSRSPEWLAGRLDDLTIVPVAVGGVLSPRALRHPLCRLRRNAAASRWLAATRQFVWQDNLDVVIHVGIGRPIRTDRSAARADPDALRQRVHAAMREQLAAVQTAVRCGQQVAEMKFGTQSQAAPFVPRFPLLNELPAGHMGPSSVPESV